MKVLLGSILVSTLFLASCASHSRALTRLIDKHGRGYVKVYKHDRPETSPEFILLKPYEETYDIYWAWFQGGTMGRYEERGDTIILDPQYEYGSTIRSLSDEEKKESSYPRVLLRLERGKELRDITDYSDNPLFNTFIEQGGTYDVVYKLME